MTMIDMDDVEKRLERRLEAQSSDLKEHISIHLEPIRVQTTRTNGRVSVMEKMVWMAAGAVVILTPMSFYLTTEVISIKEDQAHQPEVLRQAVDDAFDARIEKLEVAE